jgi:tetratricopeptide (TPR) repeat protein
MTDRPPTLVPGQRLGRYTVERLLGAGGMGEVWEAALHGPRGFRRGVALKVLHAGEVGPDDEEALVHEARLGGLVHHPNVVSVLELGCEDDRWYVAMELVRGDALSVWLREGPLPAAAVLDLGVQVCAGLSHLHTLVVDGAPSGLVHRDVKPGNLLVDPLGTVRIADLGIACLPGAGRSRHGTASYAPPEQVGGGLVDARTDVYALGRTLAVAALGAGGRAPSVERALDAIVPGLGAVVQRALAVHPDERWPSAAAFEEALSAWRTDAPGATLRVLAPRRRDRAAAAAPTVLLPPVERSSGSGSGTPAELSGAAAHALATLGVFAGGFTAEAADAVLGAPARDLLDRLVAARRVHLDRDTGRYTLPSGGEAAADADPVSAARHARWYAQLGTDPAILALRRDPAAVRALLPEKENLRVAAARATAARDGEVAAQAARAFLAACERVGPRADALPVLEAALAVAPRRWWPLLRTLVGNELGAAGRGSEAEEVLLAGIADAREAGDALGLARLEVALATELQRRTQYGEARRLLERSLATYRRRGDLSGAARALQLLGIEQLREGSVARAVQAYEDALAAALADGNQQLAAILRTGLADALGAQERWDEARQLHEAALASARAFGVRNVEGNALRNLGYLESLCGRHAEAVEALSEAVALARAVGADEQLAVALEDRGLGLAAAGRDEEAVTSWREAVEVFGAAGNRRAVGSTLATLADALRRLGRPDEAAAALDRSLRVGRELANPRVEVRARLSLAELSLDRGDRTTAEAHAAAIAPLLHRLGTVVGEEVAPRWAALRRALEG